MDSDAAKKSMRQSLIQGLAFLLSLFVLLEVNYPHLRPQSQLALFALFGMVICFLAGAAGGRPAERRLWRWAEAGAALLVVAVCLYVVVQSEPLFSRWWIDSASLGDRAGAESTTDVVVGLLGVVLVLVSTRRAVGWALPLLTGVFLAYAAYGYLLPDWLFPHRGYSLERIVSQTFLHSQGVFGIALNVMFTYVFLFVLFGAFLEATGATRFIIEAAQRLFSKSVGAPAKVSVLSSGLMGSLSGSAVANTATTGTFTIPLMRSSGFRPDVAAGVEAAASSGGALVPPVMGAGAYMMLEIIEPQVTYLQIVKAAILPAALYYLSLFLIVHFTAHRLGAKASPESPEEDAPPQTEAPGVWEGVIFFSSLGSLILFILQGYTVFRAVTLALVLVAVSSALHPRTRLGGGALFAALVKTARGAVPLICAAACVGMIIGVVTLTGVGTKLPATILPLAQESLFLALVLIMVSSIVLGMGLPSAVCYLLMATLVGPVLGRLGVVPLAAHLFIFYFGMMSMVTPPVALAAYTAGTIAGAGIMRSGLAAFRFALVGFTLPYMFVFRPELLLLGSEGGSATPLQVVSALVVAVLGILPLAAAIAGQLFKPLGPVLRGLLLVAAALLLFPRQGELVADLSISYLNLAGGLLLAGLVAFDRLRPKSPDLSSPSPDRRTGSASP